LSKTVSCYCSCRGNNNNNIDIELDAEQGGSGFHAVAYVAARSVDRTPDDADAIQKRKNLVRKRKTKAFNSAKYYITKTQAVGS